MSSNLGGCIGGTLYIIRGCCIVNISLLNNKF